MNNNFLKSVLVVTTKKGFWISKESKIFPNVLYIKKNINTVNSLFFLCFLIKKIITNKPKIIIFNCKPTVVLFFSLKKIGFFKKTKTIVITQSHFKGPFSGLRKFVDKIVVYSSNQVNLKHNIKYKNKFYFIPLPVDGNFDIKYDQNSNNRYVFSGGGDARDFESLIESCKEIDIQLKIVTFSKKHLNYEKQLPQNCEVSWTIPSNDFIKLIKSSLFVVVPLQKKGYPHGHTTIVQALKCGKAIVTNHNVSCDDYIEHNKEGLLVESGNIDEYTKAIKKLINNKDFRKKCEKNALIRAKDLTYDKFSQRLAGLCYKLINE